MKHLLIDVAGHIATVTLNRPEVRNAFNDEVILEMVQAFTELGARPDVRCIVLAANGPAFCAGADLNWMRSMADYTRAQNHDDAGQLARMMQVLYECPKPTIAKVQGDAYAGGTGLVAACDMAVSVDTALVLPQRGQAGPAAGHHQPLRHPRHGRARGAPLLPDGRAF
jgi:methylglutaconyl-CoA hydratase